MLNGKSSSSGRNTNVVAMKTMDISTGMDMEEKVVVVAVVLLEASENN